MLSEAAAEVNEASRPATSSANESEENPRDLVASLVNRHHREARVLDTYGVGSECIGPLLYVSDLKALT